MTADSGHKEKTRNDTGVSYCYGDEAPPASTKFVEMKWEVGGKLAANHQELDGGSPMDILLGMTDAGATSPQS